MSEQQTPQQTAEHERLLIACALANADVARELLRSVRSFMFMAPADQRTWLALRRMLDAATGPVDLIEALAAELGGEEEASGLVDLHALAAEVPSAANARYYAQRVVAAYARRELERMAAPELLERNAGRSTADLATGVASEAQRLAALVSGASAAPLLVDVADFAGLPQPAPVLWRDDPTIDDAAQRFDAVLSVGEVAILSSAGGLGKSTLVAAELVSDALAATAVGADYGAACGLRVVPGPVVVVSYEDAPVRIAQRLKWSNNDSAPRGLHAWPNPPPLWEADPDRRGASRRCARWDALWRAVREIGARLMVIDPVSAALADVSTSETGPVRAFLRALTAESEAAGCGVLLVAHDTKAARDAQRRGEDPGAGVVAGSAAWYDGARGVLSLIRDPAVGSDDRLLECVKANYGGTGWGARLRERTGPSGAFRGLELDERMTRADIAAAKSQTDGNRPPSGSGQRERNSTANGAATVGPDVDTSEV